MGDGISLGIFPGWGKVNATTVTFNYIIECRCQSLFSLCSFSSCLQGVNFLFP